MWAIGLKPTEYVVNKLMVANDCHSVRFIHPKDTITLEASHTRLNIYLDDKGNIREACNG